jgi:hypothetical protein
VLVAGLSAGAMSIIALPAAETTVSKKRLLSFLILLTAFPRRQQLEIVEQ